MLDADRNLKAALVDQAESELDSHAIPARSRLMADLRDLAHMVTDEPADSGLLGIQHVITETVVHA